MNHIGRLAVVPFETAIAFSAFFVGLSGVYGIPVSAVQTAVPDLALAWSLGYAVGGVLIIGGLVSGLRIVEVAGLVLLSACVTIASLSLAIIVASVAEAPVVLSRLFVALAALVRVYDMVRGKEAVHVSVNGEVVEE